ncbi:phage baseplate assembly protein V [Microbispora sp. NPDC049633]|uniref:phage baseplate assembly protein V n=1 Tax=Microbispora sp. NPDC049633 TaxID=3154355 RepID=UPI00341C5664
MRDHNGLYQGIVVSSADPEKKRRITARVPDVLGTTISEWARPASIVDSPLKAGDPVWIGFPNGDYRWPVYHVFNDPKWGHVVPTPDLLTVHGPDEQTSVELAKESAHVLGPGGNSGALLNGDLHARGKGGYHNVYATDFIKVSSPTLKTDIRPLDFDPVKAVVNAPVYSFKYLVNGQPAVGPMRSDLPEVAQIGDEHVSEGTIVGILWGAVQQLAEQVEELQAKLAAVNVSDRPNTLGKDV